MSNFPISRDTSNADDRVAPTTGRDEGSVLILVLVLMVVVSLIVVPLMTYTISVSRASRVQQNKAKAVELARGGLWVALHDQDALFDCTGLASSLADVTTTCSVISAKPRLDFAMVPFSAAMVQADATGLPGGLTTSDLYPNPNTAADPSAWLTSPDWTYESAQSKVWLPEMPVRYTNNGGIRQTTMTPGTEDPNYVDTGCRVFFPGTYTSQLTIAEPAYFTSGVYYFEAPIVLQRGADVVVGSGSAVGCTTDFEAIADAVTVPDPLNMNGLGGTFVFGELGQLVIDDATFAPSDPDIDDAIRFVMNRRYVGDSVEEKTVAASAGLSIVSVNGTHAPFVGAEVLGDALDVTGVIHVPASQVDDSNDDPDEPSDDLAAVTSGYKPSALTPKPFIDNVVGLARKTAASGVIGAATVTWDAPGGTTVGSYTVTAYTTADPPVAAGTPCTVRNSSLDATYVPLRSTVQRSCTVTSLPLDVAYQFEVIAYDTAGTPFASSASSNGVTPKSSSQLWLVPNQPTNNASGWVAGSDGLLVTWVSPGVDSDNTTHGYTPITSYTATATSVGGGPPVVTTCKAWWDETGCKLTGLTDGTKYNIDIAATNARAAGNPVNVNNYTYTAGVAPAPDPSMGTESGSVREPDPILDFSMESSAPVTVSIASYVSVPQGHVLFDTLDPSADQSVRLENGAVAAMFRTTNGLPKTTYVDFDNPIAQKTVRIISRTTSGYEAVSDAVVQVNQSGSRAINSWIVQ